VVVEVVAVEGWLTWVKSRSMGPTTVCAHNSTPANPHPWVDFDRERLECATGVTRPAGSRAMSNGVPAFRPYPRRYH